VENEERIIELLTEILHWQRFQNRQTLRSLLDEVLGSDADRLIYDLTDGKNSQPQIAKAAKVSQPTISYKWKAWRKLGIIHETREEPGRCRHLASLDALGLRKGEQENATQ
jgi:predicted transcriptional regulator